MSQYCRSPNDCKMSPGSPGVPLVQNHLIPDTETLEMIKINYETTKANVGGEGGTQYASDYVVANMHVGTHPLSSKRAQHNIHT
jgi:hypothetical protein